MPRKLPRKAYEDVAFVEAQVSSYRMDDTDGGMWRLTFYVDEIGDADWLLHCYPKTTVVIGVKALDYDNPDQGNVVPEGERQLKRAGMLCRNPRFQKYIKDTYPESEEYSWTHATMEESCVSTLHKILEIESRKQLIESQRASDRFANLLKDFQNWLRTNV